MEYRNDGTMKRWDKGKKNFSFKSDIAVAEKNFIELTPSFQRSNIPPFQWRAQRTKL